MIQWIQYIPMKQGIINNLSNEDIVNATNPKNGTDYRKKKKIRTSFEYKLRNKFIEMIKQVYIVQLMTSNIPKIAKMVSRP